MMARPGLTNHRKFRRLARAIGSEPLALGSLEFLWRQGYESGDDYLGEAEDVEAAARWAGEPGKLATALLEAGGNGRTGFIEPVSGRDGAYQIHDLFDHAPDYVQKRRAREMERVARGQTLSSQRSEAGKKGRAAQLAQRGGASVGQTADTCPKVSGKALAKGDTPAPAPAPAPIKTSPLPPKGEPPAAAGKGGKPKRAPEAGQLWPVGWSAEAEAQLQDLLREYPTKRPNGTRMSNGSPKELRRLWLAILQANPGVTPRLLKTCAWEHLEAEHEPGVQVEKTDFVLLLSTLYGPKKASWEGYRIGAEKRLRAEDSGMNPAQEAPALYLEHG